MKTLLYVLLICNARQMLRSRGHRIQKRVTYGSEAIPHSRPYQVHIIMMLKNGDDEICGGALISRKYVLTAAHCFIDLENIMRTIVIMGAHDLRRQNKEFQVTKTYIIHKGFQHFPDGHTKDDIALVKLTSPVNLSTNVQLVKLPKRSEVNESFNNVKVTEAGWGKTESDDSPFLLFQGVSRVSEDEAACTHPNALICTWSMDGHAPCTGDSGSPLVYNDTIIGVLSSGFCIAFSYHTRVTSFLDWIEDNSDVKVLD